MGNPRIGIFSAHGSLPAALALGQGFRSVGYAVSHRSLSDYGLNDRESNLTLVAVFGLREKGRVILNEYEQAGVPGLVIDFGYLKREEYWQISLGRLNCLPEFACPEDRFLALGMPIEPMRNGAGPAVLCGQLVGDQAHPFDTQKKWNAFVAVFPELEYRAHPLMIEADDTGAVKDVEPVDALLARASKIVTWNSNIGNDAWLAGVPVEAHAPDAMYKDVTPENRQDYFARLAYGQWTMGEMGDGSAARFVTQHLLTGTPRAPVDAVFPAPLKPQSAPVRRGRR